MKKSILFISNVFVLLFLLSSCYKDKAEKLYPSKPVSSCDTTNVTYTNSVKAILDVNCVTSGCHDFTSSRGGYSFETHAGSILSIPNNKLINSIKYLNQTPRNMPQTYQLTACEINKIQAWINQGAKN